MSHHAVCKTENIKIAGGSEVVCKKTQPPPPPKYIQYREGLREQDIIAGAFFIPAGCPVLALIEGKSAGSKCMYINLDFDGFFRMEICCIVLVHIEHSLALALRYHRPPPKTHPTVSLLLSHTKYQMYRNIGRERQKP